MTPEEAKKRADELRDVGDRDAVALRTLADALREAQAAVVQMREDAAKIADGVLDGPLPAGAFAIAVRISKAIRSLPAPAARTYDDGVRDQWRKPMAQAGMEMNGLAVEVVHGRAYVSLLDASAVLTRLRDALLSPAPAVAPVAVAKPGPTTPDVKFDAEAALVAQADQLRHAIGNGRQYVTCADLLLALDAGVIAGRGGGR